jgi:HAD superfamily hydrolase (TIGR01509 family)
MKPVRPPGAFDLLICDCDGVIIDSEIVCDRILMDMLREAYPGRDLAPALAGSFGLQTSDILERLAGHLDEALPPGFFERLDQAIVETLEREAAPIRGVREALEQIRLPIAVASNSSREWIKLSVERAGLAARIGGAIFSADRVARPKPAPDVYLLAARESGVAPARCLVVEDSETGVAAALAAGMSVIGFTGASHIPTHHPDRLRALGARQIVESMDRLPGVVAALDGAGLSVRAAGASAFQDLR